MDEKIKEIKKKVKLKYFCNPMNFKAVENDFETLLSECERLEIALSSVDDYTSAFENLIDSYDKKVKRLEARVRELEERQGWIDKVARPTHPDDERPWCAAYLDCRERINELEEGIKHMMNTTNQ